MTTIPKTTEEARKQLEDLKELQACFKPAPRLQLYAALIAAQAEYPVVHRDATNPHFRSTYATLSAVIQTIQPINAKHGLAVVQTHGQDERGRYLDTTLIHTSGESIASRMYLVLDKPSMQSLGAAQSYARRYSMTALLGLVDEDDDGNVASETRGKAAPASRAPRLEPARPVTEARGLSTVKQQGEIHRLWKKIGYPEEDLRTLLRDKCGQESTKALTLKQASELIGQLKLEAGEAG